MIYVIDTNSLIMLPRLYSFTYFESLWNDLEIAINKGIIISTKFNLEELRIQEDELFFEKWKNDHSEMFLDIDETTQGIVADILLKYPDLIDQTIEREQADPFLIALAISKKGCVITEEKPLDKASISNPRRKKKMKIPNVCDSYSIKWYEIAEFINSDGWRESL